MTRHWSSPLKLSHAARLQWPREGDTDAEAAAGRSGLRRLPRPKRLHGGDRVESFNPAADRRRKADPFGEGETPDRQGDRRPTLVPRGRLGGLALYRTIRSRGRRPAGPGGGG